MVAVPVLRPPVAVSEVVQPQHEPSQQSYFHPSIILLVARIRVSPIAFVNMPVALLLHNGRDDRSLLYNRVYLIATVGQGPEGFPVWGAGGDFQTNHDLFVSWYPVHQIIRRGVAYLGEIIEEEIPDNIDEVVDNLLPMLLRGGGFSINLLNVVYDHGRCSKFIWDDDGNGGCEDVGNFHLYLAPEGYDPWGHPVIEGGDDESNDGIDEEGDDDQESGDSVVEENGVIQD